MARALGRLRGFTLLAAWVAWLPAPSAPAARGTDGASFHAWRDLADGATWDTVSFGPSAIFDRPADDTAPIGPVALGLPGGFPYYGLPEAACWISENGWIAFADPSTGSRPTARRIPHPGQPNSLIAPFWKNLVVNPAGIVGHGLDPTGTVFRIQHAAMDPATGIDVDFDTLLFESGCIQFQYRTAQSLALASVGIEDAAGLDGIELAAGGVALPGVAILPGYVVEILPPGTLAAACPPQLLSCGTTSGTSPPPGVNARSYCCGLTGYVAQEAVYSFTLAEPTLVDLTLTAPTALTIFLLDGCNEHGCIAGPSTAINRLLGAGTYIVSVDALLASDEGTFDISLACTPLGAPPACPGPIAGTTTGGTSSWDAYPCAPGRDLSGAERVFLVDAATATNMLLTLSSPGIDLDVFVLRAGLGEIGPADCVAWGDSGVTSWDLPAGQYLVVIDGVAGAEGGFVLDGSCSTRLDCLAPEGIIDLGAARVQTVAGDTSGGTNAADYYSCRPAIYDGPEHVYEVVLDRPGQVVVAARSLAPGLVALIASTCNEGACPPDAAGTCATRLEAGTHYLVVDGRAGAQGAYDLTIAFEEEFPRWPACELPSPPTQATDTSSPLWFFDDRGYCWDHPSNINYPDGCTFAVYVTIDCGTEFHLALYDSESGHVRVFDVLRGEYVVLTAQSTGGFFGSGTDIQWRPPDCDTGSDPLFNNAVVDIRFDRPEGLCGPFRIEFPNHSGSAWDLHANCTGSRSAWFDIHDSLCHALEAYAPLPSVSLVSASAVYACPDVTITYTIENDGCAAARDFPVQLYDGATLVATDIVPIIDAGGTLTTSFSASVSVPSGPLLLAADGLGVVTECTEAPGAGCNPIAGMEQIALPACGGACVVAADAVATPASICAGAALTLDATSSTSAGCPGGGVLEYQLRDPGGVVAPYQGSPLFTGLAPAAPTTYFIDVRCVANPACIDTHTISVPVERPPDLPAGSVQAVDVSGCNLRILVNWFDATFFGAAGGGAYNVYRASTDVNGDTVIDCADALASPPLAAGLLTTNYPDTTTVQGTSYYYVVEAEDATPDSLCVPQGPLNRGATTRVAADGGLCVAVTDVAVVAPDLLPRVGGTLRLGGDYGDGTRRYSETFVELAWQVDRPLSIAAREHFHILRSAQPDAGFAAITTDAPRLQVTTLVDVAADDTTGNAATHLWFYLAFVADSCDNLNTAFDGGDCGPCPP